MTTWPGRHVLQLVSKVNGSPRLKPGISGSEQTSTTHHDNPRGRQRMSHVITTSTGTGAQRVGVAHCLEHMFHGPRWCCILLACLRPAPATLPHTAPPMSCGGRSVGARFRRARSTSCSNRSSRRSARTMTCRSSSSKRCPTTCTRSSGATRSRHLPSRQSGQRQVLPGAPSGAPGSGPGSRPRRTSAHFVATACGATLEVVKEVC